MISNVKWLYATFIHELVVHTYDLVTRLLADNKFRIIILDRLFATPLKEVLKGELKKNFAIS